MIEVKGKSSIVAKVVCDSVSPDGVRITTLELVYPRIIHSELMTHRMFSRNAASSRAIPFEKMLKQLDGKPVRFGAANKGMQDTGEEHDHTFIEVWGSGIGAGGAEVDHHYIWNQAKNSAVSFAEKFYKADYHKQVYNRLLEPFQMMKTVVTATEWNNFFHLRLDSAADPTIYELARCMKEAMEQSTPQKLEAGDWHLPYVTFQRELYLEDPDGNEPETTQGFYVEEHTQISTEDAIKVSAARCAAVSFRNEDYGLEKCLEVYERLVGDERVHASALEHQATPMPELQPQVYFNGGGDVEEKGYIAEGTTHLDMSGIAWSGNFKGWVQYRQLVANHVKAG